MGRKTVRDLRKLANDIDDAIGLLDELSSEAHGWVRFAIDRACGNMTLAELARSIGRSEESLRRLQNGERVEPELFVRIVQHVGRKT